MVYTSFVNITEALANPNKCAGDETCACDFGNYYIGCVEYGNHWIMAGPYWTHRGAQADLRRVQDKAEEIDPRAFWKAWGVCVIKDYTKPGRMNELGIL